jgi:subtilisin family serine protease
MCPSIPNDPMKEDMKQQVRAILAGVATVFLGTSAALAQAPQTQLVVPGEILLQASPGTARDAVDALAKKHGCQVVRLLNYVPDCYLLRAGAPAVQNPPVFTRPTVEQTTALAGLEKEPGVSVSLNGRVSLRQTAPPAAQSFRPNDPYYTQGRMWGLDAVRMPEAWVIQRGGRPVTVGVVDSGVEVAHPDFRRADGTSRIVAEKSFAGDALGDNVDPDGHGTHVAGTIAATSNNNTGVASVAGYSGGGVDVRIVAARVFGPNGGGAYSVVMEGLGYVVAQGAQAINLSLGGPVFSVAGSPQGQQLLSFIRNGIVVIGASGNNNSDTQGFDYPTDVPGVVKVNAVGRYIINGQTHYRLTPYSNFGGLTENTIAAPGGDGPFGGDDAIWSTWPTVGSPDFPGVTNYYSIEGTSMACPHVVGAAALVLAAGVPGNQVGTVLRRSANLSILDTPTGGQNGSGQSLSSIYGAGLLDVYSALAGLRPTVRLEGPQDRGVSYFGATPISLTISLFSKIVTGREPNAANNEVLDSAITVEISTIGRNPSTIVLRGGRNGAGDFEIPTATSGSDIATISVPRDATRPIVLTPNNQYKIVAKVNDEVQSTQFITIAQKTLPRGRSMFALPFKANLVPAGASPEVTLLGPNVVFSLARFNPIRLPNEDDYARYRSNGSVKDNAASFRPLATLPLTFESTDPATSVAPIGIGYWLDLDREAVIDTSLLPAPGTGGASPVATSAVGIRLFGQSGGWNMIGAPFTFPVEWASAIVVVDGVNYSLKDAINAGYISPALVGYRNGDYTYALAPSGVLEPFQAYWVRVYRDVTLLVPPVPSVSATRARATVLPAEGWSVRLAASVAGDRDGQNYFGEVRGASVSVDNHDIVKPPAGAGHAYVRFEAQTTQGQTRSLAFDMRPLDANAGRREWVALVSSDQGNADVTLSWEGLSRVPRNGRLTLTDTATGKKLALNSRSAYTYRSGEAGATRRFLITLESQSSGGVLAFTNIRMVPTGKAAGGGYAIRFLANQDAEVAGVIRTLSGKQVSALVGTGRAEGASETTLRWDGRGADGAALPAGPYVVEVTGRTADGQTARFSRTVQYVR